MFEKDPVKFREEQKIKKFLEDLLLLTKKYNLEADINRKYVIENDIYKILTEFVSPSVSSKNIDLKLFF